MKKTQILILASTVLMSLTACGGNSSITSTSTSNSNELFTEDVEITWNSTLSYEDQISTLIGEFEEEYPHIKVNYNKISSSYDGLKNDTITKIGGGNLPNIVTCYPDHIADYLDYDIVVNLDKYINSNESYGWTDEVREDYVPGLLSQCSNFLREGTFMLPHSSSTEAMFYNESILGKSFGTANGGLPITPEYLNSITWEELMGTLAPAILEFNNANDSCFMKSGTVTGEDGKEKKIPSAVVAYSGADNAFVTFCAEKETPFTDYDRSTGSGKILFNDNNVMKDTLKYFNGYYKQDIFTTAGIEGETNINVNEKLYSVFSIGSTGGIKYQLASDNSFSTGVMRIPNFEGHPHKVLSQGPGLCVLKAGGDKEQLASYLFINFLNRPENTLYWSVETGYTPVRVSCFDTEAYAEACSIKDDLGADKTGLNLLKAKVFTYLNEIQDDFFTNVPFKGSSDARSLAGTLLNKVVGYTGELTDQYVNEQFAETVNSIKNKM